MRHSKTEKANAHKRIGAVAAKQFRDECTVVAVV